LVCGLEYRSIHRSGIVGRFLKAARQVPSLWNSEFVDRTSGASKSVMNCITARARLPGDKARDRRRSSSRGLLWGNHGWNLTIFLPGVWDLQPSPKKIRR
jgi:hypothetical protein